jgi:hypothetical protein
VMRIIAAFRAAGSLTANPESAGHRYVYVGRQKFCNSFLSQKRLDAMPALRCACCGVSIRTQAAASAARASMDAACRLAAMSRLSSRQSEIAEYPLWRGSMAIHYRPKG